MLDRTPSLNFPFADKRWLYPVVGVLVALLSGWLIGTYGWVGALLTAGIPLVLLALGGILMEPRVGLLIYLHLTYVLGFSRFLNTDAPVGLMLDAVLILTLVSTALNGKRMQWHRLNNPVFYLLSTWLVYTLLEYFNPESPYPAAWFYHARSFSLNWFYIAIIVFVTPITKADIRLLINTWLAWSAVACLWAFKQQYIGLEGAELRWLAAGNDVTHLLWGKLRSFSFYSDASQFGAEMAGVTLICLIRLFDSKSWLLRIVYLGLACFYFWGYAISGTRSALFVLLVGYPAYLLLLRKPMPILRGALVALPVLAVLLFTNIGDSIYHIYRIRTALRPTEDASFQVRLINQAKLRNYLKDLPFGAGIGSSADTGRRFSPNHFAAIIPPDSWYVELWIETGIVGLTLYVLMILGIIGYGTYKVWQLKDPWTSAIMIAFLAEFIGIAVTSYSNPILGQFPTSTIVFISTILIASCDRWDTRPDDRTAAPAPTNYPYSSLRV